MLKNLYKRSTKDVVYFKNLGNRQTILQIIDKAKKDLITGLRSVEDIEGWHDPTVESAQSMWTCVEVCKSLIEASEPIYNLDGVLHKLEKGIIEVDEIKGWESESIPGAISTYLTSDIGLLYQSIGRHKELQIVLNSLIKMQNSDGGWGVCSGDQLSRTRATCFVIMLYARCLNSPWAYNLIDWNSYIVAIDWLTKAQNDDDGGWGNMSDLIPSDVTATALAINAILSSKISLRKHPNLKLPIRDTVIALGIKSLIRMGKNGSWRGVMEDLGIKLTMAYHGSFRHTTSGVGTLLALQAVCKASRLGYLGEDQNIVALGLDDVLSRITKYSGADGMWIVPSDQNGPPTAWNTAFALDAFLEFQRLYVEFHTKGIVDVGLTSRIIKQERMWKSITVVLVFILFFLLFIPRVSILQAYVNWFNNQSAWTQGIAITFLGIAAERIISFTNTTIANKISKDRKKGMSSNDNIR